MTELTSADVAQIGVALSCLETDVSSGALAGLVTTRSPIGVLLGCIGGALCHFAFHK
jgi:hypothetical protein